MKAESVIEFLELIKTHISGEMYRGHANIEWDIEPSLARLNFNDIETVYGNWSNLEKAIISEFQKFSTPYIDNKPEKNLEWMIHAQHYGIPTRLLDWSTNPLKALFFTVSDSNKDDSDGAVFTLTPEQWFRSSKYAKEELKSIVAFHPIHINERIVAQEGCFTLFPLPSGREKFLKLEEGLRPVDNVISLSKVVIPKESKKIIRSELKRLGVSSQSIFPGLDGIAKSLREQFCAK